MGVAIVEDKAADITPVSALDMHSTDWMIKVMLIQTSSTRMSKKSSSKEIVKQYKCYIFVDEQGTKIKACTFDGDITKMDKCLVFFKTYEVNAFTSKAMTAALPGYNHQVELILNQKTTICPIDDMPIQKFVGKPPFMKLSALPHCLQTKEYIDIVAIVIDSAPPKARRNDSLQESIIITEE